MGVSPAQLLLLFPSIDSHHGPEGETLDAKYMSHDDDTIDFLERSETLMRLS